MCENNAGHHTEADASYFILEGGQLTARYFWGLANPEKLPDFGVGVPRKLRLFSG
jgi:hypothetical protein